MIPQSKDEYFSSDCKFSSKNTRFASFGVLMVSGKLQVDSL